MRILLVEDDDILAETLTEAIASQRYAVDTVEDGETAWMQIKMVEYDLIVLDVMLPKLDGISLCRRLRAHNFGVPVLMLTARDTSMDKVAALDSGADDYMVKPFDLPELLARIRALLRRGDSSPPVLQWTSLRLDPNTREVTYADRAVYLTPKEFCILELLMRNGRRVLSRSLIIEHIWSFDDPPSEDAVKAHIKSLRYKLKAAGAPNDLIETVHGVGYRLNSLNFSL